MAEIEIEIDGKKLNAQPNQTVIEVADAAGIYIPRFCYHKQLSIAANCRMCLVEVEKSPKALPACATPVMPGMKVFTKSAKTQEAQRAVMEFLLINHPLDCPICDQGGECELQDLSMGYGSSHSHYDECKRSVANENLGPLIATEMTRCILCTRCVRFCDEIAGIREIGVTERGGHAEISTYVERAVTSEVSGNIIDLCPVGALTSKPYLYTARAWELDQAPSISPHDCVGTNVNVHTRYGKVMRVVTRENMALNGTWIADRERFSYAGLHSAERVQEPMMRVDGQWVAVEWQKAFEVIANKLHTITETQGADQLGALASPSATLEEFYLLQKIMRGLGSSNIDHRLRERDTSDQAHIGAFPALDIPIDELDQCDAIVLIGSNIQKEQPLLATRIRKAARNKATVIVINPKDYDFNFQVTAKKIVAPQAMVAALHEMVQAYEPDTKNELVAALANKQRVAVLVGALAQHHPQAAMIRGLAQKLATLSKAKLGLLTDGANAAGAWLAGAIPHRRPGNKAETKSGLSAYAMLENPRKAYVLLNVDPALDCANAALTTAALKQAEFVVALSIYRDPVIEAHADVILPMAAFTETSGTFVNTNGMWQAFNGMAQAFHAARPAWKILRVLGNFLHLEGFNFESSEEVRHEVKAIIDEMSMTMTQLPLPPIKREEDGKLYRIGEVPIYAVDSLVRHSEPLQEAQHIMEGAVDVVKLHPDTAKKLALVEGMQVRVKQQHGEAILSVVLDTTVALHAAWVAGGVKATASLGDLFGSVEISAC